MSGIDSKQNASYTAYEVSSVIYFLRQQQNESLDSYYRRFLSIIKTAKVMGISYDQHEKIIENVKDNCPSDTDEEIKKNVSDRYETMIFLMRADKFRYENLWVDLRIKMSQEDDRYPIDINSAQNILYNYLKPSMNNNNRQIILSQINEDEDDDDKTKKSDASTPGIDGICNPTITCYKCGKKGHIRPKCPLLDNF